MSEQNTKVIEVEVGGKTIGIKCLEAEVEKLQEAAKYLNQRLADFESRNKIASRAEILTVVSLNVVADLTSLLRSNEVSTQELNEYKDHLELISKKIEKAVAI